MNVEKKKDEKIQMFQQRLQKVKSAALWLDHITQEHTDDAKKRKKQIGEVEDNLKFLHEKLMVEKQVRQRLKKNIYNQRKEFDTLYLRAQEFIQTSDDTHKIQQLLDLLDED